MTTETSDRRHGPRSLTGWLGALASAAALAACGGDAGGPGTAVQPPPPVAAATAESVSYEYDELNRLARVRYGDGAVTTFTYDAAGNITRAETTTAP